MNGPLGRRVIIVGAGWGGQGVCAGLAASDLPADVEIACVDDAGTLAIGATWQYELDGRAEAVALPLEDTAAGPYLRETRVDAIDFEAKTVALADSTSLGYDFLVLACGAVSDPREIEGLESCVDLTAPGFSEPIRTFLDALTPSEDGAAEAEGAEADAEAAASPPARETVLISICKCPYKCPPLPFEIAFLTDAAARRRGVRDRIDIVVTCPVPWPFGGPKAKKAFTAAMEEKGIAYRPNTAVVSVAEGGGSRRTVALSAAEGDGVPPPVDAALFLATFPHVAAPVVDRSIVNLRGSVTVDLRSNRVEDRDGVYCVGDACSAALPGAGASIPKAGEFAWEGGRAVGRMIAEALAERDVALPTERRARCVAEAGGGRGIAVGPDFSAAFTDPEAGKPTFEVSPTTTDGKVDWINGFLAKLAGPGKAPAVFAPAAPY